MHKPINSLYIHFPFCKSICNYCDFYKKTLDEGEGFSQFHNLLSQSFKVHEKFMRENGLFWGPLKTLYFGGGTPSLWGEVGVEVLEELFNQYGIEIDLNAEVTMEVNPDSFNEKVIEAWQRFGVNRFSLGVQSLDSRFSKILDRAHTLEDTLKALEFFSKRDLNYSVDFMLGLPFSVPWQRDILKELEVALKYNPKHFSVYILTIKGDYPYKKDIPGEEWIEKEYLDVSKYLSSHGHSHYEVSNFGLTHKESQHNLRYWEHQSVAAIGPSATGFFNLETEGIRYKWNPTSPTFSLEKLNSEEMELEKTYLGLRNSKGLPVEDLPKHLADSWKKRELAEISRDNRLYLNSKGYLILDSLMDEIFSSNSST